MRVSADTCCANLSLPLMLSPTLAQRVLPWQRLSALSGQVATHGSGPLMPFFTAQACSAVPHFADQQISPLCPGNYGRQLATLPPPRSRPLSGIIRRTHQQSRPRPSSVANPPRPPNPHLPRQSFRLVHYSGRPSLPPQQPFREDQALQSNEGGGGQGRRPSSLLLTRPPYFATSPPPLAHPSLSPRLLCSSWHPGASASPQPIFVANQPPAAESAAPRCTVVPQHGAQMSPEHRGVPGPSPQPTLTHRPPS
ncbi:hypothetical protein NDU88_005428 [Pleurodeles waltl]|uniref:Uncharacterized protein n=1 Tax=Pleurodeles waltl TaxID=8319 RepID=A0AAV7LCF4_PLEWA|nr:hypothetical protein NDU88_005428 [Pleurodeles waltl]